MNRKRNFDEDFLKKQIKEGQSRLGKIDINSKEAEDIIDMIDVFELLLGIENDDEIKRISLDRIITNLNSIINGDLHLVSIEEWRKLKDFCKHVPKYYYKNINNSELPKNDENILRATLSFYKIIDLNVYGACKRILSSNYQLINFVPKKKFRKNNFASSFVFECDHLELPFINISGDGDLKYPITVHELRHAANYYLYGKRAKTLLGELPSIYSEILFTDKINKYYNCDNLYNLRINNIGKGMVQVVKYINILERFDKCGRELDRHNIYDVLRVTDNKQLLELYKKLLKSPYLKNYNYIISILIALELREYYYDGYKDKVNETIENITLGSEVNLNYDKLVERYIDYTNYVYSLSHK